MARLARTVLVLGLALSLGSSFSGCTPAGNKASFEPEKEKEAREKAKGIMPGMQQMKPKGMSEQEKK